MGYDWRCRTPDRLCGDWLNGGKVEGAWLAASAWPTR
jgi:predicted NAD/FAD-dependent oxidoreductase